MSNVYVQVPSETVEGVDAGTATLSSGSVTVANALVSASYLIFCSYNTISGTPGSLEARVGDIVDATSFKLRSSSGADNSTVNWWIINKQ